MATRAQVRFATREEGVSFSEHPDVIHAQFYVHYDGYPEGLGIEIAESLTKYQKIMHWEIESLDAKHGDLEYIYYVWQTSEKSTWISIFKVDGRFCEYSDKYFETTECIFVGEPSNLIDKYKLNTKTNG
jgi:hypothetical protein|tara:strand:+ start:194 stop:580 length:387 start_codon:yes stop_codon:yes gene_type:complete